MERKSTRLYWERLTGRTTSNSTSRMTAGIGETKEEAKDQDSSSEDDAPSAVIAHQKSTTKATPVIVRLPTAANMTTMTSDHNNGMKHFIEVLSNRTKDSHMDLALWIYNSEDKLVTFEETVNNIQS